MQQIVQHLMAQDSLGVIQQLLIILHLTINIPVLNLFQIEKINAPLFSGSGASLTNLPAASLTGTIDSARIPTLLIADIGNIPSIDHDALTNFVGDEHVAHSGVSITAGFGLKGGGTIASTRDLAIDSAELLTYYEPIIRHDNLSGFVANEHIDHTSVSITAGVGLKGGGTIASTRDLAIDSAELTTYYRPLIRGLSLPQMQAVMVVLLIIVQPAYLLTLGQVQQKHELTLVLVKVLTYLLVKYLQKMLLHLIKV